MMKSKNHLMCQRDLKAPGLDGMPAIFFKKYWDVVGEKLTREVQHVLKGERMH